MIGVFLFCGLQCVLGSPPARPQLCETFSITGPTFKNSEWQLKGTLNWVRRPGADQKGKGAFESRGWEFTGLSAFSDASLTKSISAKDVIDGTFTLNRDSKYYVRVVNASVKENDRIGWLLDGGVRVCSALTAKLDFEIFYDAKKTFTFAVGVEDGKVTSARPGQGMAQKLLATGFIKMIVGDVGGKDHLVVYGAIGGNDFGQTEPEVLRARGSIKNGNAQQLKLGRGHEIEWCIGDGVSISKCEAESVRGGSGDSVPHAAR